MSGYHAMIAPSALALTVACNGWLKMAEGLPPEPDTPEAMEGNAADWVAKQTARGVDVPYGSETPIKGYPVDYDMLDGARLWASTIRYGANSGTPVVIERIHPTQCWGEPDGWTYDGIEQTLHVPDYKYGFDLVEVFENWQVIAYAIGLLDMLDLDDQVTKVRMSIVQPRAFHPRGSVRVWETLGSNLRAYANIAHGAAIRALPTEGQGGSLIKAETVAGPHCMTLHCPARGVCPTLDRAASHVAEWTRDSESPLEMTADAIGTQLTIFKAAKEVIDARCSGLAAQAEQLIRMGHRVRGFTMESGGAPLKWNPETTVDDVLGLGVLNNKDMRKPLAEPNSRNSVVITPTQAVKAGISKDMVKVYASPTPSALKLVADDGSEARKAFGGGQ